ncbi:triacylglycerol lipase [Agreia sp. COWG]|uniref:esterase/lipase family protein n=1 Tax=Agreia sp. COWG TaxID=2773266 RepID=UPI001AF7C515|nr:alpha/beta hydrolase [Agreia sp. COWG]CAD5991320.1 Alpha/beta hydrolase [Agreia sp. COWG]
MKLLRDASWWARDYAYALYWQARAIVGRTPPSTFASGSGTPIVVLPGVYETWRFLQPLVTAMHDRGHPVHVIDDLNWNNRPVIEAADRVERYLVAHELTGVVLVAHSKGGLIGKYVMTHGEGVARVHSMLAVAAPFGGSRYAPFLVLPSLRIFSPGNAVIRALGLERAVNARIVSIYGLFDPHVPEGSELVGAKNVRLATGGHFRVLADPRVLAELAVLAEGSPSD